MQLGDACATPPRGDKCRARVGVSPCTVIDCEAPPPVPAPRRPLEPRVDDPHLLRTEAACMLQTAWCALARDRDLPWMAVDIEEVDAHMELKRVDARTLVITTPEQDPMGVVACATGVARWLLTDAYLADHLLDVNTRVVLATVLFVVQKMKSEDRWHRGSHVALRVLARFLRDDEIGDWMHSPAVRSDWYDRLQRCEARLVCMPGMASVVDGPDSLYGTFETALEAMHKASELDDRGLIVGAGVVHFYLHAAHSNRKRDTLALLGAARSVEPLGVALALVVLVTCRLVPHLSMYGTPTTKRGMAWSDSAVRAAAHELVRNAAEVSQTERHGAYADETSLAYSYVSPAMLSALMRALV